MGSEWQEVTLGDASLSVQTGPFGSQLHKSDYVEEGIPSIMPVNIADNRITTEGIARITEEDAERLSKYRVETGDVVYSRRGDVERRALVREAEDGWLCGTGCLRVRFDKELVDPEYASFQLGGVQCREWIVRHAIGATMPNLNTSILSAVPFILPPLPEQKAIAHILGTLDDKIELNRRMNATLEGMAQALFKSWFVDFDPVIDNALAAGNPIPDELAPRAELRKKALANGTANREAAKPFPVAFQETESMGWIPEGWELKRADEIADISIGKTPPRKESHWFSNDSDGNVTWVSIRDMGSCGVFIGDSNEYITPESVDKFNVKVIPRGSVLLSFKLTVGRVSITQNQMTTNEAIAHFVNPKFGLMKQFVYSYLKAFDFSNLGSTSSIATAVNSKIIKAMPFLVPNSEVLEHFEEVSRHWFNAISIKIVQTNNLTKIRDTLLPKLISGDLRTEDAELLNEEEME